MLSLGLTFIKCGLTRNGMIKVNSVCPFYDKCNKKEDTCPSKDNQYKETFDCRLSRAFTISKQYKERLKKEFNL